MFCPCLGLSVWLGPHPFLRDVSNGEWSQGSVPYQFISPDQCFLWSHLSHRLMRWGTILWRGRLALLTLQALSQACSVDILNTLCCFYLSYSAWLRPCFTRSAEPPMPRLMVLRLWIAVSWKLWSRHSSSTDGRGGNQGSKEALDLPVLAMKC